MDSQRLAYCAVLPIYKQLVAKQTGVLEQGFQNISLRCGFAGCHLRLQLHKIDLTKLTPSNLYLPYNFGKYYVWVPRALPER